MRARCPAAGRRGHHEEWEEIASGSQAAAVLPGDVVTLGLFLKAQGF